MWLKIRTSKGEPRAPLGSSSEVSSLSFGISHFSWACGLVDGF